MPMYETPLPVSASNVKIVHNGEEYNLVVGTDTFTRVGKDGNEVILPLCGGDEFVGEVLPGEWKKGWDANISTFTARILAGVLEITGVATIAGTMGKGWINNQHPFVMMNESELTFEMEVPISDTGAVANRDVYFQFFITEDKIVTNPESEINYLQIRGTITEAGLLYQIYESVAGVPTLLWDGSTYDGASVRDPAALRFTIWRVVFHDGVAGATAPENVRHMHVYLKQGSSRVNAEAATEYELGNGTQDSPYDISAWLFNVGYPAYLISTENTTYFGTAIGSANGVDSTYLRVDYPNHTLRYDFADVDYGDGDVELWDTMGSVDEADWQRVLDEDHVFTGDEVLQNGLVRAYLEKLTLDGLKYYYWSGATWTYQALNTFYLITSAQTLAVPVLSRIVQVSPEKTTLEYYMLESTTDDRDDYILAQLTLERGKYSFHLEGVSVFPSQDVILDLRHVPANRFCYIGDDGISDDDIDVGVTNATLTDNILISEDDLRNASLITLSTDKKPTGGNSRFEALDIGWLRIHAIDASEFSSSNFWFSLIPFSLIANLFEEAEDATLAGGAARYFGDPAGGSTFVRAQSAAGGDVGQVLTIIGDTAAGRATDTIVLNGVAWVNGSVDFTRVYILDLSAVTAGNITVQDSLGNPIHVIPAGTTHVDNAVLLTAQNDRVYPDRTAGAGLPEGRYLIVCRMYDVNQIFDDMRFSVQNTTDASFRNEINTYEFITLTAGYIYYAQVFDITAEDVSGANNIRFTTFKAQVAGNTIYVDYFLIIPIGDGESWPQDLAHATMREFDKPRRLYER